MEKQTGKHGIEVPQSKLVKKQELKFRKDNITDKSIAARRCSIEVVVRWDDRCNNGHNDFSITGTVGYGRMEWDRDIETCGCIHDVIEKHFPELAHLIEWHLASSVEPSMYYIENTQYWANSEKGDNMEYARKNAHWNDATEHDLMNTKKLIDRAPALMERMKKDIENIGLIY